MTTRRAVTYGGLTCLLAAWLASAASTTQQQRQPQADLDRGAPLTETEALAGDVQAQAVRLRQRLASAPGPDAPHRNPFLFESRPVAAPRLTVPRIEAALPSEPPPAPEPVLVLVGVAEDHGPKGLVRTAILTDDADGVFIVPVGQTVINQYRVEAIGADAVELKDIATGAVRRLALR
jgi:hypothetical protein